MDKYQKDTVLRCNVTTSPSERPLLSRRLSRRPKIVEKSIPDSIVFQGSNNEKTFYRMGEPLVDLSLSEKYFHEDDKKFLDEIEKRGREVYIYSGVPGSLLQHCPLTRGVRGDPNDGVYYALLVTGTTVFFPRGDTSSVAYLEETDFYSTAILANGIQNETASAVSNELPLGRGVAILSETKNQLRNTGLADDGTDIYNWTLTGAGGIGGALRRNSTGWRGVSSLQLWGTNEWAADPIDISGRHSEDIALSFGWRTDGEIEVEIDYDGGGYASLVVLSGGSGYYRGAIPIPAAGTNLTIKWSVKSGTFSEFDAPQIIFAFTGYDRGMYYPYLQGYGDGICGRIVSHSLKYTGDFTAGMDNLSTSNSALVVSGFVQPLNSGVPENHRTLFSLKNSLTGKYMDLWTEAGYAVPRLCINTNTTWFAHINIPEYTYGDTIFVAMVTGWIAGVKTRGIYARVVGGTVTYSATYSATTTDFCTIFDEFYPGVSSTGLYGADTLFQDVNIWAGTYANALTQVEYMSNPANLMEHRDTVGRLYHLKTSLAPNPHNRQRVDGLISCENTKVL